MAPLLVLSKEEFVHRLALALCLTLLTSTACGPSRDTVGAAPTATEESPLVVGMLAQLVGRLDGNPTSGCLWLATPKPVSVVWPKGFIIRRDPLQLVGPTGEVIARPGDILQTAGGSAPLGHPVDCKVGERVFIVSAIEAVTPSSQSTAPTP